MIRSCDGLFCRWRARITEEEITASAKTMIITSNYRYHYRSVGN